MFGSGDTHVELNHAGGDHSFMTDVGLLALRLTTGGLLAGHGAQKLFGTFSGPGIHGTGDWLESMGMKPGCRWAAIAGASELTGGALTALGMLNPVGPITALAPMSIAIGKVHWGKPIWVTSGGAELPVTNIAVTSSLALAGPGRFSLDRLFGLRLPWYVTLLTLFGVAGGIGVAMNMKPEQAEEATSQMEQPEQPPEQSRQESQPAPAGNGATPVEAHSGGR